MTDHSRARVRPLVGAAVVVMLCSSWAQEVQRPPGVDVPPPVPSRPDSRARDVLRATVDVRQPPERGRLHHVRGGMNLQAALNEAQPGDSIVLEAGARFTGTFRLPRKTGTGWIVVRSDAMNRLPGPGIRVTPADATFMPVLEASGGPVIAAEPGAHHFWFMGVRVRPAPNARVTNLVELGHGERRIEDLPHHIVFDRSYLHGDAQQGTRRGIALNSRMSAVIHSHLSDFKDTSFDAQAIGGWNGPGPFLILNNYLEASGENVLFGGADPTIHDLVPADIDIRGNHFYKPRSWQIGDREYLGTPWLVKNLLELKNAERVRIEANLFEHNWAHGQNGMAILFTPRNQDGRSPWSVVRDVAFVGNVVRNVGGGITVLGTDDIRPSRQTERVLIADNLFEGVGGIWGQGRLIQLLDGVRTVTIEHNTAFAEHSFVLGGDHDPHQAFAFRYNIVTHGDYGLVGAGTASGLGTLARFFPGAQMVNNVIIGGDSRAYPPGNAFVGRSTDVFVAPAQGDYRVRPGTAAHKAGPNGADLGANVDRLQAAYAAVQGGRR